MTEAFFNAIKTFVADLGEFYSSDLHSLALYERLLNKTALVHTEAVDKHIQSFQKFLNENEDCIVEKKQPFVGTISYSAKVFIDLNAVFALQMDEDTKNTIYDHLLTLLAVLCGSTKAKDVLKEKSKSDALTRFEAKNDEEDFLNSIMSKVEKHVNSETTNPQEAISSIMSSGMIPELVSSLNTGITSGKIDLTKMMSSVQKMVGNIAPEAKNDPNLAGAMNMLSNMMGMMGGGGAAAK